LLINTAERDKVDRILVVQCRQINRITRIKQRNGWSEEKIQAVMDSQPREQSLIDAADDLIDNNHTIACLAPKVEKLHKFYIQQAETDLKN
jgi:dephospho-CoA kinase